jgi:branched-chain amino acid transport system substrate-binding protein
MTVRRPSRPRDHRRLAAAALVPALALLAACTGGDDAPVAASGQKVKIGLLAPLEGPNATAGSEARRGAQLAVDLVNGLNTSIPLPLAAQSGLPRLGGSKLVLSVQNSAPKAGQDPQVVAGDAVNKLVSGEGVDALIGAYDPLVTEYASQRSERYEVPFVNADSPATYLTDAGRDWFFRIGPSWRSAGEAFFSLVRENEKIDIKKIVVLHAQDKAGQDVLTTVQELTAEGRRSTIVDVPYPAGTPDQGPTVDKVKAEQPDAVLLYVTPSDVQPLVQAFTVKAYTPKIAMSFSLGYLNANDLSASAATLDGLLRSVSWAKEAADRNPAARAVSELYQRKFNTPMSEAAASAFTAVMTVAQAVDNAGTTDAQQVRSALLSLDVPGEQTIMPWSGIRFDETHQNVLAQSLVEQYTNRAFHIVYPSDATASGTTLVYPARNSVGG